MLDSGWEKEDAVSMASSTISVSLPQPLNDFVASQVESGAFGTPADYIRELILEARDRRRSHIEDQLEMALLEQPISLTSAEWAKGNVMELAAQRLRERE